MRSIFKLSAVALTALTLAAQSASAQFTQLATRPVGGTTTTWGGVSGSTYTTGNVTVTTNTTFNTGPYVAGAGWSGGFTSGDNLLFGAGSTSLTYDFASAIHSFGTQAWYNRGGGNVDLVAYFMGSVVGSFSAATGGSGAANLNQATVYAFSSTSAVDRVVLTAVGEFAVDELDTDGQGTVVVTPEPTSAAMIGGALIALGFIVRRRKNRAI